MCHGDMRRRMGGRVHGDMREYEVEDERGNMRV